MAVAGVYLIKNDASDKVYVGRSINVRRRWVNHRWHLNRNTHRNSHLQRAWDKHGEAAFSFEVARVIEAPTPEEREHLLQEAEVEVLRACPSTFNLMQAGEPAMIASKETREKLSAHKKGLWADPVYKARLSASQKIAQSDPALIERKAASISATKSMPEARAKTSEQSKEKWAPGGVLRETQSAKRRENWQDEGYVAQQRASRKAVWDAMSPEERAARGAAAAAGRKAAKARRAAEAKEKAPPVKAGLIWWAP